MGIGDVFIQTSGRCKLTLKDMWHVSDLYLLIFVNALDKHGYANYFTHGNWKLSKG